LFLAIKDANMKTFKDYTESLNEESLKLEPNSAVKELLGKRLQTLVLFANQLEKDIAKNPNSKTEELQQKMDKALGLLDDAIDTLSINYSKATF